MSDTKLRDLERRWKETQSVEDEAAYLLERVRSGNVLDVASYLRLAAFDRAGAEQYLARQLSTGALEKDRLALAAHCGHVPAMGVLRVPEEPTLDRMLLGLARWGQDAWVRALVAGAEVVLPSWKAKNPEDTAPEAAVRALSDWLLCPCESHRAVVVELIGGHDSLWSSLALSVDAYRVEDRMSSATLFLSHFAELLPVGEVERAVKDALVRWSLEVRGQ